MSIFRRNNSQFNLIELISVIVVIGILAAIIIPNTSSIKDDALGSSVSSDIRSVQDAVDIYKLENNELPLLRNSDLGNPQRIDFDKLVPKYLRNKPKQGNYWVDHNDIVYGSTSNTPRNVDVDDNGLVTWEETEGAVAYQVYEESSELKSDAAGLTLVPAKDGYFKKSKDGKYSYSGEEGKQYFVSSFDQFNNETPAVNRNYRRIEENIELKFESISAGGYHNVAIMSDGSLFAWGSDEYGQVSDVPEGNDFVSVSTRDFHSVALREDGSLVSWGNDSHGQVSNTPTGNDFVAMSTGNEHTLALKSDGSLVAWGGDEYGQVSDTPKEKGFIAIGSGRYHNVAIKSDGTVVSWGYDHKNQVTDVPKENGFILVDAGFDYSVGLKVDGTLVTWGGDNYNQRSGTPDDNNFISVDAGSLHNVALRSDGSIASWGYDKFKQVEDTPAGNDFVAVSAGYYHSIALKKDGTIVAWGNDEQNQVSDTPKDLGFISK